MNPKTLYKIIFSVQCEDDGIEEEYIEDDFYVYAQSIPEAVESALSRRKGEIHKLEIVVLKGNYVL